MDPAIQARLDAVRRKYALNLRVKVKELKATLAPASQGDPKALTNLFRQSHTIYGTAGTMGFSAVSDACRDIEAATKTIQAGEASLTSHWPRIEAGADELEAAVEALIAGYEAGDPG